MFIFALLSIFALADNFVDLVTFDGSKNSGAFKWKLVNDPVMGGVSKSTWTINRTAQMAQWIGDCRIVPSLKAPGFCNAETSDPFFTHFNNAAGFSHLQIKMRSRVDYHGFKISFAANTWVPQFKSFKADFNVTSDGNWQVINIPFSQFSNDWSASTGEPVKTCSEHPEVCPTDSDLAKIESLGFWTEGVKGHFDVDIEFVRAVNAHQMKTHSVSKIQGNNTCSGKIQNPLRFGLSQALWSDDETLTEAICCDSQFAGLAEQAGTFQLAKLFETIDKNGVTTFYDPVCGKPLFNAPKGRTFDAWKAETEEHGWPSFRDAEVVKENIEVRDNVVYSSCGTRLGDNLPDGGGNRYCLDLACLAGNPTQNKGVLFKIKEVADFAGKIVSHMG